MLENFLENVLAPILFFGAFGFGLVFYIYTIVHFHRNKSLSLSEKRFWLNVVYCMPLIGSGFYHLANRARDRREKDGKVSA
ncbi:MAG: hypothetical protein EOP04_09320 [Proteobacteria bacterium]|nr:MAG: hypothetical protein EOP04_09320 [Pseudomonadota bacterium]